MDELWAGGACGIAGVGHQVAIHATDTGARSAVKARFSAMIQPLRGPARAHLAFEHAGDHWKVLGSANVVEGSLETALCYLRYQVTHSLMAARPDLLWLHAAAVARDGRAVLIAGASGSGKSTLATGLLRRDFSYLGDEVIPLDPRAGLVHPFPLTPAVRRESPQPLAPADVRRLGKVDVPLDASQIAHGPYPVGALVFPSFAPGEVEPQPLSPARAALELARQCLDLTSDHQRALPALARLASRTPAAWLVFDDIERAAAASERLHAAALAAVA